MLKGGGQDLTRTEGQMKKGEIPTEKRVINLKAAEAERARQEKRKLSELKARIEQAIENSPALKQYRNQLLLEMTSEGLRIQVMDEFNRPMFASGSALVQSYARDILREIGKALNDVPNAISVSGHTDAKPYPGGEKGYSNWELSADRANAARRELIAGGLVDERFRRVVGLSSAVLFDAANALNPINRRISILVMNKQTEEAVSKDGGTIETEAKEGETGEPEAKQEMSGEPPSAAKP